MSEHGEVSDATTDVDEVDARATGTADRAATPDEERVAEEYSDSLTDSVRSSEEEMMETGANVKGEGEV